MAESKQLAVVENVKVPQVLNQQDVMEEMDGMTFNFAHVKIPSGGGLNFEVPGDDPDSPDAEKELDGVIVHHHPINAYWADSYTGGNEPPDCSSMDGKVGTGNPGGVCKTCPMNEWGSGSDEKGKACQNRRRVYILRQGEMFPLLISLPPTSLQNYSNFISRSILQKSLRSYSVVSKVKLRKAKNAGGIEYSQATWAIIGKLDDKTASQMKDYSNDIKALASGVMVEDVEGNEANSSSDFRTMDGTVVEGETPDDELHGFKGKVVDGEV